MGKRNYNEYNAQAVLDRLNKMIDEYWGPLDIDKVYDDLSIFDWWPKKLNIGHLKQMQSFLKNAIKLGYTGYVCFKVGASGCANGMWASKAETTDGYSPKGETMYRSFTPDYTYYSVCDANDVWYPSSEHYNEVKTIKQLIKLIASL